MSVTSVRKDPEAPHDGQGCLLRRACYIATPRAIAHPGQ
jgi:hypothetical protein